MLLSLLSQNGTDYFPINPSANYDGYRPPFAIGDAPREQMPSNVRWEPQAPCEFKTIFASLSRTLHTSKSVVVRVRV